MMEWETRDMREVILKDINYTDAQCKEDVKRLREWFRLQPHLPQTTSDKLLEVFLVASKSLERAKEKLDSYFSARTAYPGYFCDGNPEPLIESTAALNLMYLPKLTDEGYRVVFISFKEDSESLPLDFKNLFSKMFLFGDYWYNFGPLTSGAILFLDLTNCNLSCIPKVLASPIKTCIKIATGTNPVRAKKFLIYNANAAFVKVANIIFSYMDPKFSQRIVFVDEGDHETIKKHIPEIGLPKDYGGNELPSYDLAKAWEQTLLDNKEWCQKQKFAKSDESKRLGKPNSFLTELNFGLDGTFKKLSID